MSRPLLLDLFCCEGGAAMGYYRAGFDVIGVDIVKRPRYPFPFVLADTLEPPFDLAAFDAIHASPPCQAHSITKHSHSAKHPDLLQPTLDMLAGYGGPWVVENVEGAPLPNPVTVCGAACGLTTTDDDGLPLVLKRHRLFSSNVLLLVPPCACSAYRDTHRIAGVYSGGSVDRHHAQHVRHGGYTPSKPVRARLMGIDHMTMYGLAQAIPPAYTELIGAQLLAQVGAP